MKKWLISLPAFREICREQRLSNKLKKTTSLSSCSWQCCSEKNFSLMCTLYIFSGFLHYHDSRKLTSWDRNHCYSSQIFSELWHGIYHHIQWSQVKSYQICVCVEYWPYLNFILHVHVICSYRRHVPQYTQG